MPKRIHVVDANLAVRKLMEFALSREGFEVSAFTDGLSALDSALKTPPALFILDCRMEGMDLTHFLEKARQRETLQKTPVVLLINAGDNYDEPRIKSLGLVDTIKKPIDPIELVEKIKTHAEIEEADTVAANFEASPPAPSEENIEPEDEMVKIEELLGWSSPSQASPFSEIQEGGKQDEIGTGPEGMESKDQQAGEIKIAEPIETEKDPVILFEDEMPPASAPEHKEAQMNEVSFAALSPSNLSAEQPALQENAVLSDSQEPDHVARPPEEVASVQETSRLNLHEVEDASRPIAEEMVGRIAQEVVEKVAWEVVPSLAETAIKKEAGPPVSEAPPETASAGEDVLPRSDQIEMMIRQISEEMGRKVAQEVVEKVAWEVIPALAEIAIKKEIERLKADT